LLAALAFVLASGLVGVRTVRNMNVPGHPTLPLYAMNDFRDASYYPVAALLEGNNPYDVPHYTNTYPVLSNFPLYAPITLLVHLPFGLVSQQHAQAAHLVLDVLLTLALAMLALRGACVPATPATVLGVGTLVLASHPGHMSLFQGQCTIYVVIGVYVALLYARSRPAVAGLGLALACLKPTFGIPAGLLMLARGDIAAVLVCAGVSAAVSAGMGILLVRAGGGLWPFLASLRANYAAWDSSPSVNIADSVHRLDGFAVVGRLLGRSLSTGETLALSAVLVALAALAVRRVARLESGDTQPLSSSVIAVGLLIAAYHQAYDALVLTLPAIVLATGQWERAGFPPAMRRALLAPIALLGANYLSTYAALDWLGLEGVSRLVVTSLSGVTLLVFFTLLVTAVLWPAPMLVLAGGVRGRPRQGA